MRSGVWLKSAFQYVGLPVQQNPPLKSLAPEYNSRTSVVASLDPPVAELCAKIITKNNTLFKFLKIMYYEQILLIC